MVYFIEFAQILTKILSSTNRLRITTPEQYEQFKSSPISAFSIIHIESPAHPQILSEPKQFADASYREIHFTDVNGNRITLYPQVKAVFAFFREGENLTLGIPSHYKEYQIMSVNTAKITETDLDYILQWNSAVRLDISDRSDIAITLSNRVGELKAMTNLKILSLNIHHDSYGKLRVKPFLNELQSVQYVNILAGSLTNTEFQDFLKNQETFNRWVVQIKNRWVVYRRDTNVKPSIRDKVGGTWLMERQKEHAADRLSRVRAGNRDPIDWSKAKKVLPDHLHWSSQYTMFLRRMNRSVASAMWWTMKKFH